MTTRDMGTFVRLFFLTPFNRRPCLYEPNRTWGLKSQHFWGKGKRSWDLGPLKDPFQD